MPTKKVTKSKKVVKKTLKGKTAPKKVVKSSQKMKGKTTKKSLKAVSKPKVTKTVKTTKTAKSTKKVVKTLKKVPVTLSTKKTRSFKVKLPESEVYEGRFTGLTPYQAANKALSKYYRDHKSSGNEIVFSIRESTRGSKRLVYHYTGHRTKLEVPVEYVIKSGSENKVITKNFKNRLTKIKKAELKKLNLV